MSLYSLVQERIPLQIIDYYISMIPTGIEANKVHIFDFIFKPNPMLGKYELTA